MKGVFLRGPCRAVTETGLEVRQNPVWRRDRIPPP
jgi:hypothetical protein